MHAPQVLRALVRADEIWLVVLAAFVGFGTGIMVWLMTATTQLIHEVLFGISRDRAPERDGVARPGAHRRWSRPSAAWCWAW